MMLSYPTLERKPRWDWKFDDNGVAPGVWATAYKADDYSGQILIPTGLSESDRDALLWTYEAAWHHGKRYAEEFIRTKVRKFLEIY